MTTVRANLGRIATLWHFTATQNGGFLAFRLPQSLTLIDCQSFPYSQLTFLKLLKSPISEKGRNPLLFPISLIISTYNTAVKPIVLIPNQHRYTIRNISTVVTFKNQDISKVQLNKLKKKSTNITFHFLSKQTFLS